MHRQSIKTTTGILASLVLAFNGFIPVALAQANGKGHALRGFSDAGVATEINWEEKMRAIPKADLLREYMKHLSAEPHHVGSAYDKQNAEWIRDKYKSWGIDAKLEEFEVLFPTPTQRVLEMIEPTRFQAVLKEPAIPEDPTSGEAGQLPTYNAYSIDGDVTGQLVYVNYGVPADYDELEKLGIEVKGKIVIARYGASWRGIKPKVAAEHGAIGCLIYSDPKDDGYYQGDVFPRGPYRPEQGVQRGSVMDMPIHPGDPLTPGWGSVKGARRIPLEKAEVYKLDLGGGFGRRGGTQDYTRQAVSVAKQFPGTPVKLVWTREEDMQHDFYRPISMCKLTAGLDEKGELQGLSIRLSGQSINAYLQPGVIKDGRDMRQVQGLYKEAGDAQFGYTVPNLLIEYAMRNSHVPVGPWRGVNTNQNGVYLECFMEEVARAAGKDSFEFRRALMKNHPKHLGVLEAAAEKGDWGKPLPPGRHRGIAQFMGYGSYSAATAEVSISDKGELRVHRMVLALNCGHAVNPDQIAAQVEGSVVYGLSAALYGEITVENGRVAQSNFHDYTMLKLAEMPKVETVIVPTYDFWGGVGEPTICVVTPAVLNAIQAATGKPVRSLPLRNAKLV